MVTGFPARIFMNGDKYLSDPPSPLSYGARGGIFSAKPDSTGGEPVMKNYVDMPKKIGPPENPEAFPMPRTAGLRRDVTVWGSFMWGYADVGADIYAALGLVIAATQGGNVEIVQTSISPASPVVNKKIKDFALPQGTLFVAIYRGDETIVPRGDTVLLEDDQVLVLVRKVNWKS